MAGTDASGIRLRQDSAPRSIAREASAALHYREPGYLASMFPPVLAAIALHVLFLKLYLGFFGGNLAALICCADNRLGKPSWELVNVGFGPGHDGQFYYALAQSPFLMPRQDLDLPARQLRILYPVLGWLFTGGDARLLFYVMPALNLMAIALLAWIGADLARRHGRSAWWGVLVPVAVGAGLSLLRDFTDLFSALAVLGLLAAWLTGQGGLAVALWAAAAVFSREQNIAIVGVILLASLCSRRGGVALGASLALVAWAGWVLLLRSSYGAWPNLPVQGNFNAIGEGMHYRWLHLGPTEAFSRKVALLFAASMLHLTLLLPVGLYLAARGKSVVVSLVLLGGVLLTLLGGEYIYQDYWSYNRVFAWLPLGIWVASIRSGAILPLWLLAPAGLWSLAGAMRFV